jgi:hypothetical protein
MQEISIHNAPPTNPTIHQYNWSHPLIKLFSCIHHPIICKWLLHPLRLVHHLPWKNVLRLIPPMMACSSPVILLLWSKPKAHWSKCILPQTLLGREKDYAFKVNTFACEQAFLTPLTAITHVSHHSGIATQGNTEVMTWTNPLRSHWANPSCPSMSIIG